MQKSWNRFLQEVELAKNYHLPYALDGIGTTFRNPLLDYLLPSLLYVKMVALLDHALVSFIRNRKLTVPPNKNRSLHDRIEFLNDQSLLANYASLSSIRKLRNLLAHRASDTTTWGRLDMDLDTVESELQHLGFVGNRPDYQFFGERSAMRAGDEPGVGQAQDFRFGIKLGDRVAMEFAFTKKIYNNRE